MRKNKKGFTLIELVAVLVIMAIIALIVTPLVMNIIKKARVAADKRSIDAYGRSIELAIAGYLMDTGTFPTQISQLTIEYSGDEVVCSTTQLNSDSSVYLAECRVAGRAVAGYTYGKIGEEIPITYQAYNVGDEIEVAGDMYRVVANSGTSQDYVTALKANPLTVDEIDNNGAGHINRYGYSSIGEVRDLKGDGSIGGIAYYTNETCLSTNGYGGADKSGCINSYDDSDIKYIVDNWADSNFDNSELKQVNLYKARLITFDEIYSFGYGEENSTSCGPNCEQIYYPATNSVPEWISVANNYDYWTMSPKNDSDSQAWRINSNGIYGHGIYLSNAVIRPVINVYKTAITQ